MSTLDQFDLSGQAAIVTGGTRGIGRAIAHGLAEAGADVVAGSRTESDVADVAAELRDRGADTVERTVDVSDDDSVAAFVEAAADGLGGIDIVVNNAGFNPDHALGDPGQVGPDGLDDVLDVNLRGGYLTVHEAAPYLEESGGAVVNVASVGGLVGLPRQHPYVASKHGLVGLTKSMALDWAPDIRVNALAPGYVATELTEDLHGNETLADSIRHRTPLDRFAEAEELAAPVVFLASDAASYVTGAVLSADGGWTAR